MARRPRSEPRLSRRPSFFGGWRRTFLPVVGSWLLIVGLGVAALPETAAGQNSAWRPLPSAVLARVRATLPAFERVAAERVGDVTARRLVLEGPHDTVTALYPAERATPGVIYWSREAIGREGCRHGRRVVVSTWAADLGAQRWTAMRLVACPDEEAATLPRPAVIDPTPTVAEAAGVLDRFLSQPTVPGSQGGR